MRSVPRISYDMNRVKKTEPEAELFFEEHESKTVFFATRRDFLYTKFIEDPQLVLQRQKELEEEHLNNIKEEQIQNPDSPPLPPPSPSISPLPDQLVASTAPSPSKINKKQKNQKEPSKVKPRPIKKLTRTEISNVIDRLASLNDITSPMENQRSIRNANDKTEKSPIRKKYIDSDTDAVFERLYCESTQRKTEKKDEYDDDNKNQDSQIPESDAEILTKSLALQKIKEMIDASFPDKQGITINELKDIFIRLGIIDNCEKIEKIPQISYIVDKWKIRNTDLYDSSIIKNVLTQSIIGRKGKFKYFARERMFSYLANRKNNENSKLNQQPLYSNQLDSQINHSKKLTQETFDRLLSPRPDFSPPKNEEEEDINNVHFELSPRTQKILKDSEYGNATLEERDRILTERAMAKIENIRKQMEKERLKMLKKKHSSAPKISPEERAKIDELKLKRQKEIENERQPYKPDVMKYSDFLHLKESMTEEKEKPPGFDAFLGRIKKGYEQHQKKKFDEENIRSLPELPSKKRAASIKNKKKKEKPPEEKQETIEPTEPIEPNELVEQIPEPNNKIKTDKNSKEPNIKIKTDKNSKESNIRIKTDKNSKESNIKIKTDKNSKEPNIKIKTDKNSKEPNIKIKTDKNSKEPQKTVSTTTKTNSKNQQRTTSKNLKK